MSVNTADQFTRINIRPMQRADLEAADRVVRVAFGTFLGMPNPEQFMGDAAYVQTRWEANPSSALVAELSGNVVGSNFATNWGSFGFFGPLTVLPKFWGQRVAQQLLGPTMEIFDRWGTRHRGLFTFAHSPKHMALYQKFGFWPRDLVAIMNKNVNGVPSKADAAAAYFSRLNPDDRSAAIAACREVTNSIFDGLDVSAEIASVSEQGLGETVLVRDGSQLAALAVCHIGPRTEAGSGTCYIKFAAVRPGSRAISDFRHLLNACEHLARERGTPALTGGVNLARREAFREMFDRGFRTAIQGVAMETGDGASGYNRAGVYIIDDWR